MTSRPEPGEKRSLDSVRIIVIELFEMAVKILLTCICSQDMVLSSDGLLMVGWGRNNEGNCFDFGNDNHVQKILV